MKKSTFIVIILAVVALSSGALAGCGRKETQVPESTNYANQQQPGGAQINEGAASPGKEVEESGENPQINGQDIQMGGSTMTFEEFMIGIKEDLAPEVMEELREIYEEWLEAEEEGDSDKIIELYETIEDMGVLTMEEQEPMYKFRKAP